ncbi:MAG TPA: TolC family protein [Caulobacteraceae bacterium]|jgi:NodT family efflux transporter outer membrane factor (OMF) lipoprotein|nr:TolC family protein [Caulobacteraceae bacterium]
MNSRGRLAGALLLAALAAGCAGGRPRAPDLTLPARYDAPSDGTRLAAAQLDRWWLEFQNPQLNALEDEALRAGPDALTAYSRVVEARAVRGSAIDQTLPQGSISGALSKEHEMNLAGSSNSLIPVGGDVINKSVALNVSWELDVFGRLAVRRRIASANWQASRFDIEAALASLVANVASDYFQATGLKSQIGDAQETVNIDTELAHIADVKAQHGLGAQSDADRVDGDLAQAQAQLTDLQSQYHASRRQLLILIGRKGAGVDSLIIPDATADAPAVPAAIPGELLQRRPDIREADAKLRAQAGTGRLRHLAFFPTFTMAPAIGLQQTTSPSVGVNVGPGGAFSFFPEALTTSLGYWTLAGNLAQPLLNIPQLLQDAKAEDARTEQAVVAYEKTVQTAFGEAENALVSLDAGRRAVTQLTGGEARSHRAYDAARRRYAMGLDDLTSALTTEQAWRGIHLALTNERVQALQRAVTTYKALGGGWESTSTTPAAIGGPSAKADEKRAGR